MASAQKISELTTAGPLTGAELVPIVQNGGTLQTTVSAFVVLANISLLPVVSALQTQIAQVSAATSVNAAAITSTNAVVGNLANNVNALSIQVNANTNAITSVNAVADALEVRVSSVSAAVSVNAAAITSINAEVSLKAYRSGDYLTNVRYINFDTSVSTVPVTVGQVSWNTEDGTLEVGLYDGVTLKTGQNTYFYVKNDNAVTIPKGSLAMATGTLGASGKIIAEKAVADGSISAEYFLGVAANSIPVGNFGYITAFGLVRGMDTTGAPYGQTWANGDLLYANASVVGGLTNIPPAFPGFSTPLAIVINADTTNTGSIFVRMKTGEYLRQLHDVDLTTPVNNDVLLYDTSVSAWVNSPALTNAQASISALDVRVAAVSASVSSLNIQMAAVQASISAINSALAAIDVSALGALEARVSALEIRVDSVSALVSVNTAAITSTNNVVSVLEIRVSAVSALASALDVRVAAVSASVSALQIQVDAVSAALTSINNVVSALEIRVSAASATGTLNTASIVSINAVLTSILAILTNTNFRVTES